MSTIAKDLSQLSINTVRTLSIDGVQAAGCGHPGAPMGLASVTYQLWTQALRYDPTAPLWPNRDRYVLSCGHASMLLYSMLHLAGVRKAADDGTISDQLSVSLDDLRNFRQWDSPTPGHPEYGHTTGVETTTGPLGQGCGNSVGMAIAGNWLGATYNRPDFKLFDYNVYAQCSDGDLMEGVAGEAASLAGHLKLSNLCWIYDDNSITIEGRTDLAFSEDVGQRFQGLGWNVVRVADGNDLDALAKANENFLQCDDRPTLSRRQNNDRLRIAQQGRHGGRPRFGTGRRRDSPHQGCLRLAGGRVVHRARGSGRALSRHTWRTWSVR